MVQGGLDYDLSALASLIRDWASESLLVSHSLASFLIVENMNDLHPLIAANPRTAQGQDRIARQQGTDVRSLPHQSAISHRLTGVQCSVSTASLISSRVRTLGAVETMLKTKEHAREKILPDDLVRLKKQLVERDCNGLIEFIESTRTLEDIYGQEKVKAWLRQDITLWKAQ